MFTFFKKHKKLLLAIVFAAGGFLAAATVYAAQEGDVTQKAAAIVVNDMKNSAVTAVGWIVYGWVWIIGQLCVLLVAVIIWLAKYNNFVDSSAVENGWVIIRDVVNMFFILILLVIAFATIFNVKEYKYQAMLPRLLIMAVVINFSRTIAGILIDFGQVVMLTFVNGFQAAAGGNFIKALKIEALLKFDDKLEPGKGMDLMKVFASFILAAVMITVTAVVLGAFAIMLVMRIVILWFLVVLSPIAFLTSVWPSGRLKQNYAKWWDMFLDNIMVGPLMAFFLWLSLLVLGNGNVAETDMAASSSYEQEKQLTPSAGYTQIGTLPNMISYLMGIGMLLGSLYMAQSMRSAGAGIAGAALGKMQAYASAGVRKVAMAPVKATKWAGKKAAGAVYEKSGVRAYKDAVVSAFRGSKFGKFIGAGTKEHKDTQAALRTERALRATGQTAKADTLRSKLELSEQEGMRTLTNNQLRDKADKRKEKDSIKRAAAARELATQGELGSSDFKEYSEGDKRLEFALRAAAKKSGNEQAMLGYQEGDKYLDPEKQFRAVLDKTTSKGQREKQFVGFKAGAMINEKGEMFNEYAHKMVGALRTDEYSGMSVSKKREIDEGLLLAHNNVKDPAEKAKLEKKYEEFHGAGSFAATAARQNELVKEQEQNVAGRRKEMQEAGVLKKSDVDKSAEQALTYGAAQYDVMGGKAATSALSNELNSALAEVAAITDDTSANLAGQKLDQIRGTLETIAKELDNKGRTTRQYAADGHEMKNEEVMKAGRIYQNIEAAKRITDQMAVPGAPLDKAKRSAASAAVGISARDMNDAALRHQGAAGIVTEEEYVRAIGHHKVAARKGREMLSAIPKISGESKRRHAAKLALKQLANSLRLLEKQGASFPALAPDIEAIKQEIERLRKKEATISQDDVDSMNRSFDNVASRLS